MLWSSYLAASFNVDYSESWLSSGPLFIRKIGEMLMSGLLYVLCDNKKKRYEIITTIGEGVKSNEELLVMYVARRYHGVRVTIKDETVTADEAAKHVVAYAVRQNNEFWAAALPIILGAEHVVYANVPPAIKFSLETAEQRAGVSFKPPLLRILKQRPRSMS